MERDHEKDLQASIKHDVMCDSKVLETWSEIAYIITPKYEAYILYSLDCCSQFAIFGQPFVVFPSQ